MVIAYTIYTLCWTLCFDFRCSIIWKAFPKWGERCIHTQNVPFDPDCNVFSKLYQFSLLKRGKTPPLIWPHMELLLNTNPTIPKPPKSANAFRICWQEDILLSVSTRSDQIVIFKKLFIRCLWRTALSDINETWY